MFGRESRLSRGTPKSSKKGNTSDGKASSVSKDSRRTPIKPSALSTVSPLHVTPVLQGAHNLVLHVCESYIPILCSLEARLKRCYNG